MIRDLRYTLLNLAGVFLLGFAMGCAAPIATPTATALPPTLVPPTATTIPPTATVAPTRATGDGSLLWRGHTTWGNSGAALCKQYEADQAAQTTRWGFCDKPLQTRPGADVNLPALAAYLAPFTFQDADDHLEFRGAGTERDPAWERALVRYAQLTYAELETGHVCASCPTVLSWFEPAQSNPALCYQVYVTFFGQAVAQEIKCHPQGDAPTKQAVGWLTTAELKAFDTWLYSRGAFQDGDNYLNGEGTQSLSATDQADIRAWTQKVYKRLLP